MAKKEGNQKTAFKSISSLLGEGGSRPKIFFFLLSVFLWFLIKLGKDGFVSEVSFPIEYNNFSDSRVIKGDPPSRMVLKLKGVGFTLLNYKVFGPAKLHLSPDGMQAYKGNDDHAYWLPNQNLNYLKAQLDGEVEVLSASLDTLHLYFTKLAQKKLKVVADLEKQYPNSRAIYGEPRIEPDYITVTGPQGSLDEIEEIYTEKLILKGDKDSLSKEVTIRIPGDKITTDVSKVRIGIGFVDITEEVKETPIKVINLPALYDMKLFPASAQLKFRIPVRDYERLRQYEFHAFVDYNDIAKYPEDDVLSIYLDDLPGFIDQVKMEPRSVEYILQEK